jgi:hypothetical protein
VNCAPADAADKRFKDYQLLRTRSYLTRSRRNSGVMALLASILHRLVALCAVLAAPACRPATIARDDSAAIGQAIANEIRPSRDTAAILITVDARPMFGALADAFSSHVLAVPVPRFDGASGCARFRFNASIDSVFVRRPDSVDVIVGVQHTDHLKLAGESVASVFTVVRSPNGAWRIVAKYPMLQGLVAVIHLPQTCAK